MSNVVRRASMPARLVPLVVFFLIAAFPWGQPAHASAADIVLYASGAEVVTGDWTAEASTGAAGGRAMVTPDAGWSNVSAPSASPANAFELSFDAPAQTAYRVWLRLRAAGDSKWNDAVWVQFSDAVFPGGGAAYRTGTTSGLLVNLAPCGDCGTNGWGWKNSAYWLSQETRVVFASAGRHTIRIQTREDGVSVDQVVLSPVTYMSAPPGPDGGDTTILPASSPAPSGGGAPYTGTPSAVPGTIDAAQFDSGGEGVGYHDLTDGNTGGAYRSTDVDLQAASGGGYNVGWVSPGEWLRYTVDAESAGTYEVQLRVASPTGGMPISVDAGASTASASVPATGGWQNWTTVTTSIALAQGTQEVTVRFPASGLNFRSMTLAATSGGGPVGGALTYTVRAGEDLQRALDQANPGDTILLEAGATFVGNFVLPAKPGGSTAYITIRSAAPDGSLPGPDVRITPADADRLPRLQSPNNEPVISTAPGAHHYRLLFLELLPNTIRDGTVLALGDGSRDQDTLGLVAHHLEVDRVYLHGDASTGQKRGIALNSGSTTVANSWIADIKQADQESQAIAGWNGPGPYTIVNNYVEAAGENLMFGGADPAIAGLVPSDIVIRGNLFSKPTSWRSRWQVKNLLELKNAQRVVIDGNVFENNWQDAQQGYAVLMKSTNQEGTAPWSVVQDVTFTNNLVRHVSSALNILGQVTTHPSVELNRITIRNNCFVDVSAARWGGAGRFLVINGGDDITVDHNTAITDGTVTVVPDTTAVSGFRFTDNVILDNGYAIKGAGTTQGTATFDRFFPGANVRGNIVVGAPASLYPTDNYYPATVGAVGFVDPGNGDYRLAPDSIYRGAASDGTDPGCRADAVAAALAGVVP